MRTFSELKLHPAVQSAVARMGITTPTPIQAQAIPELLAGRDVIGQARTGSGKTLAFALPIVERVDPNARGVQALVLVPTRELAIQVGSVAQPLAEARGLKLSLLYGGRSLVPEASTLKGGVHIVVGTPGRTLDHLRQGTLSLRNLAIFVLDEGDEMLDRGFAPDVERILDHTPRERQTALFSATVPDWVMTTAKRHLTNPAHVRVDRETEAPPEIEHVLYDVSTEGKLAALRMMLDHRGDNPIIVFGRTKHGVKKLAKQLFQLGYPAAALQGNMSQNARERVMADFRAGTLPILLATNVAARGIDVTGVDQVINYELPESAELFTHRVGRTGRMGRQGEAITFITPDEAPKWRQIERSLGRRLPRRAWPEGYVPANPYKAPVPPPPEAPVEHAPRQPKAAKPAAKPAAPARTRSAQPARAETQTRPSRDGHAPHRHDSTRPAAHERHAPRSSEQSQRPVSPYRSADQSARPAAPYRQHDHPRHTTRAQDGQRPAAHSEQSERSGESAPANRRRFWRPRRPSAV